MRALWTGLSIMGIAALLTGCGPSTPPPPPKPKPCTISTNLPNNAMGRLGIQTIQIGDEVRIVIPSDKVFIDRTPEISPKAYDGLNILAKYLKKYPQTPMVISGHTDEMGTYYRDAVLSQQQAESLIMYFCTRGVNRYNFTPVGMGKAESATVASNRSLQGKADNRRIEINFRA